MIRIAVVSDTHGEFRYLGRLRAQLGGRLDWLLHAGDFFKDADRVGLNLGVDPSRVRAVAGNCDYPAVEPVQQVVEIGGVRLLLVHGHREGVKAGLQRLYYRGLEAGARVVIFGHTHVPVSEDDGRVLLFNPGSLSRPVLPAVPASCGLLTIDDGQILATHFFAS